MSSAFNQIKQYSLAGLDNFQGILTLKRSSDPEFNERLNNLSETNKELYKKIKNFNSLSVKPLSESLSTWLDNIFSLVKQVDLKASIGSNMNLPKLAMIFKQTLSNENEKYFLGLIKNSLPKHYFKVKDSIDKLTSSLVNLANANNDVNIDKEPLLKSTESSIITYMDSTKKALEALANGMKAKVNPSDSIMGPLFSITQHIEKLIINNQSNLAKVA